MKRIVSWTLYLGPLLAAVALTLSWQVWGLQGVMGK